MEREFAKVSERDPSITVMQWNILADQLATDFPQVDPSHLAWSHRESLVMAELDRYDADIICLEENDHFEDLFGPALQSKGYESIYKKKDDWHKDGISIHWKTEKFTLISQDICQFPGSQFAVCAKLDSSKSPFFVIATHLKAKKQFDDIRCQQVNTLLEYLSSFQEFPIIICGDFNSLPTTNAYDIMLNNSLGFKSAYRDVFGEGEPSFTTYKVRKNLEKKTEDYIWTKGFDIVMVLAFPDEESIGPSGLPSSSYPSDHLSLVAKIDWSS